MTNDLKLKDFISKQFPQIFREDGETLVKFIEYYYEWLQESGNPLDVIRKINYYRDVDRVPEKFYTFLRGEFMKNMPQNLAANEALLFKNIKDFYRAKGSESAFKLLFKILYDEDITFYYPAQDILRTSDGRWRIDKTLLINPNIAQEEFTGFYVVRGETSGASARFEKIVSYIKDNYQVYELFLSYIDGSFQKGEKIFADGIEVHVGIVDSDGVITKDGYYEGTYGFLSSDKYLQDNYYYQEFSYVIKSSKTIEQYQDAVKNLVHPAGLKMFGAIEIETPIEVKPDGLNWSMQEWLKLKIERQIDYVWDALFDNSSSVGTTSRQIILDYWENRKFTNTYYFGQIANLSYKALTYSQFDESRNTLRGIDFSNIDVNDVIVISGQYIKNSYEYKVDRKDTNKRIVVKPSFETQILTNGKADIYKQSRNADEIPYTSISTTKREDKLIITGALDSSYLMEYYDDYLVDIMNIGINEFDSGRIVRSKHNQFGVMAETRVYNAKKYGELLEDRILSNESMEALTTESNQAITVETYPPTHNSNIFVKRYSKKYGIFSEKITDVDNTQDVESLSAVPLYVLLNNEEIILTDENDNELTNETDFDLVSFA